MTTVNICTEKPRQSAFTPSSFIIYDRHAVKRPNLYTSLGSIELASDDLHSKRLYTVRNGYASKFAANAPEYIEKYVISSCIFRAAVVKKRQK